MGPASRALASHSHGRRGCGLGRVAARQPREDVAQDQGHDQNGFEGGDQVAAFDLGCAAVEDGALRLRAAFRRLPAPTGRLPGASPQTQQDVPPLARCRRLAIDWGIPTRTGQNAPSLPTTPTAHAHLPEHRADRPRWITIPPPRWSVWCEEWLSPSRRSGSLQRRRRRVSRGSLDLRGTGPGSSGAHSHLPGERDGALVRDICIGDAPSKFKGSAPILQSRWAKLHPPIDSPEMGCDDGTVGANRVSRRAMRSGSREPRMVDRQFLGQGR